MIILRVMRGRALCVESFAREAVLTSVPVTIASNDVVSCILPIEADKV